ADARDVLEQDVAAGEQGDEREPDRLVLAFEHRVHGRARPRGQMLDPFDVLRTDHGIGLCSFLADRHTLHCSLWAALRPHEVLPGSVRPTCLHGSGPTRLPTCLHGSGPTRLPTCLHGSRSTRLPTFLHTDPPLPSPHRSTSATEILENGEFSRISAHERSLAEAARPGVRTLLGRPPRPPATHRWGKIPTFLHLSDLGKRKGLNTNGVKRWNTWREVEYCGCYRSRWVSKGVRRHVLGHSYAEARRQGSPHPARKVPRGAVARTR